MSISVNIHEPLVYAVKKNEKSSFCRAHAVVSVGEAYSADAAFFVTTKAQAIALAEAFGEVAEWFESIEDGETHE